MNPWSRSSMLVVSSVAASESVLATTRFSTPITSYCSRIATNLRRNARYERINVLQRRRTKARRRTNRLMCSAIGTNTFPAMCPHFFVPGAWSSMWIPAAPASTNNFVNFIVAVSPPCLFQPQATTYKSVSRCREREEGKGMGKGTDPVSASATIGRR